MYSEETKTDRYKSFKGIDCFKNAITVLNHALKILEDTDFFNEFWQKFIEKLSDSYHNKEENEEKLLYHICSNVYYLDELFELAEDEEAIKALEKCEEECC